MLNALLPDLGFARSAVQVLLQVLAMQLNQLATSRLVEESLAACDAPT
jgi:hypothetical protein